MKQVKSLLLEQCVVELVAKAKTKKQCVYMLWGQYTNVIMLNTCAVWKEKSVISTWNLFNRHDDLGGQWLQTDTVYQEMELFNSYTT